MCWRPRGRRGRHQRPLRWPLPLSKPSNRSRSIAVVTAYANGIALDRSDPKLHEAYVARMVDLGLPELAYHQAQTLTTLQSSNGLAWGVVAYVDARRGQMADAISAINLASQFAPENAFVAHSG